MSGIEGLTRTLLDEARAQALRIKEEARAQSRAMIKKATKDQNDRLSQDMSRAMDEAEAVKNRKLIMAKLDARMILLEERRRLVDEVFDKALQRLVNTPPEELRKMIENAIADLDMPGDEVVVSMPPGRSGVMDGMAMAEMQRNLAARGKSWTIRLESGSTTVQSGFLLRVGKVEIDASFESQIRQLRSEIETDIMAILFGPAGGSDGSGGASG